MYIINFYQIRQREVCIYVCMEVYVRTKLTKQLNKTNKKHTNEKD